MNTPPTTDTTAPAGRLGTFAGVFTPSILTILGIILFLRLGYVVGSAGLGRGLLIIALANAISILTSISLSAISTNLKVRGGGDYYLISRTLGLEFGGSIGLVLFLAQSVSIAFYCIGFAEATASFFPQLHSLAIQLIATGAVGFLFIFAWQGADWATRFQFGVMALLTAALLSFFIGGIRSWDSALLAANWATPENGVPFWILFAIFFPAVTGFTQGVSMSGDLADPGKSIPSGTFLAVGLSIVVYVSVAVLFAAAMPNSDLSSDYGSMKSISAVGFFIDAGVIAATLFLGGYDIPFVENEGWLGPLALFVKVLALLFGMVWVRATLPRFRYDRLMAFGWKILLPVAIFSVFLTAALVVLFPGIGPQ